MILFILVVRQARCAKVVGATSSGGIFLVGDVAEGRRYTDREVAWIARKVDGVKAARPEGQRRE